MNAAVLRGSLEALGGLRKLAAAFLIVIMVIAGVLSATRPHPTELSWSGFSVELAHHEVASARLNLEDGVVTSKLADGGSYETVGPVRLGQALSTELRHDTRFSLIPATN